MQRKAQQQAKLRRSDLLVRTLFKRLQKTARRANVPRSAGDANGQWTHCLPLILPAAPAYPLSSAQTQVGAEDAAPGPGPYQPDEDAVKRTVIVKNLGYDIGDGALRDRFKDVSSLAAGRADLQLT